jgi:3-hydroxyacyl-CoA dehydrogenase/enoyl-CoA hydratase/3-hydroxybutyryl-CoA epimerase/3-hydroxyacyl-CoA dehydrogenase/enoyl-CoA hydratase/3-hydroxybutyryl-CoA epimerase/enoyl-CoA isomerase
MAKALAFLTASASDGDLAACDLVIEAVVENADVKRKIFERIEPQLGPDAILASNTSTIPITGLAQSLKRPEQFCGIHFFNPVRKMKLVEVIRGQRTSDETVATAVAHAKRIGKMPIVVNDGPGFLVNRLLFPYMQESLELLGEGAEIKQIERAAKTFGMPMGPIELYDMVGLDTALYAGRIMWEAFPNRITASPILPAMVKAGRLGQKNGLGFFSYKNKKQRPEPDSTLSELLNTYSRGKKQFTQEELTARLFLPMLLEATRALQDQIVRDPRDIDLGLIFGLGFPPFRGGLMFWADSLGAAKIIEMLKPFASLGERMQPTPLLLEMAQTGRTFYQG